MTINVACIGAGIIVEDIHFPMLSKLKGYRIVGVCDIDKARSARVSDKFGCEIFPSYGKMLQSDRLDVVLVTSPSNTHAGYAIRALNAGKHVIVDKPPATRLADLKKMFAAAVKNDRTLITFQNRRWDRDFLTVRKAVNSGKVGNVFYIESNIHSYGFGSYGFFKKWRTKRKYGGGQVLDWGPHLIDQMMLLVDSPVETVWADLRGMIWSKEVDDHCMLVLRFRNGVVAKIVATGNICHPGFRWFVCGLKGVVYREKPWEGPIRLKKPDGEGTKDTELPMVKAEWVQFYRDFEKAYLGKGELPVKPEESLRVMKVIDAARKSARTGQTVRIRNW